MSEISPENIIHIRSNWKRVVKIALGSTLLFLLVAIPEVYVNFLDEESHRSSLTIIALLVVGGMVAIVKLLTGAVDLTLTSEYLEVKRGFGVLKKKGARILLKNIYRGRLAGSKDRTGFKPKELFIIYKSPEQKKLRAEMNLVIAAIPDALTFLQALITRAEELQTIYWGQKELSRPELEKLLGIETSSSLPSAGDLSQ